MLDDIRASAIRLSMADGYDSVTVSMIAQDVGISVRTFFNYYPNKDAALMGPEHERTTAFADKVRSGQGPILGDLEAFVANHLASADVHRGLLRDLMLVAQHIPHLNSMLTNRGNDIRRELICALSVRMPTQAPAAWAFLADLAISALRQAFESWVHNDTLTTREATAAAFDDLRHFIEVAAHLSRESDIA